MVGATTGLLAVAALVILVAIGVGLTWLSLDRRHAPALLQSTDEDEPD